MKRIKEPEIPAVIEIDGASPLRGIMHKLGEVAPEQVQIDMRVLAVWKPAVGTTTEPFGRLDVVVNNAGIIFRGRDVLRTTLEEWEKTFAVNVRGLSS